MSSRYKTQAVATLAVAVGKVRLLQVVAAARPGTEPATRPGPPAPALLGAMIHNLFTPVHSLTLPWTYYSLVILKYPRQFLPIRRRLPISICGCFWCS